MRTIWEMKDSPTSAYYRMKSPSTCKWDWEDLDKDSYRSINSGNLIDNVISKNWSKVGFSYSLLEENEIQEILPKLSRNPMYIRVKNPIFGTEFVELEVRCSKKSAEMLETGDYNLSFNLVQKKKVSGQ